VLFSKVEEEHATFDKFYYMSDFLTAHDDYLYQMFCGFPVDDWIASCNAEDGAGGVQFNPIERQEMQDLPNEEFLIPSGSKEVRRSTDIQPHSSQLGRTTSCNCMSPTTIR